MTPINPAFSTCDLLDAHESLIDTGVIRVLSPIFQIHLGRKSHFHGKAYTLKIHEDNTLVRSTLEQPGNGQVLMIDGGGSLRCALVGGNLGILAEKNGWSGIVVYGCIRDSLELNNCNIGIRALGLHPQKTKKLNTGQIQVPIQMAETRVNPGDFVYCDVDGVIVSTTALIDNPD